MTIPLNLTAPLKKLDYNYIGLENGYFNTDCTGDPFGIKANNIYPWGTIIQMLEEHQGVQIYIPDLFSNCQTIYIRSCWEQNSDSKTKLINWLRSGATWKKIVLLNL